MELKKIFGGLAIAATMAFAPMTANAVTITTNEIVTLSSITTNGSVPVADPGAGSLLLGDLQEYNILLTADNNGAMPAGFTATQTFVNNTSFDYAFSAITQLLDADFTGEFLNVTVGAVTTALSALPTGSTFAVTAGDSFTIEWGATDIVADGTFNLTVAAVPLPAGFLLLLSGIGGLVLLRRRRDLMAA